MKSAMSLHMSRCSLIAVLMALLAWPCSFKAQSTFGTLTGTITDPSGAVVGGAKVTITNKRKEAERTVLSSADGSYLAPNLDAGMYDLNVEAAGFQKLNRTDVELLARQTIRVDARLEVGAAESQQVEVTASVGVITTDSPTLADSKSGREINELALNFRATENTSPLAVATLVPECKATATIRFLSAGCSLTQLPLPLTGLPHSTSG
jgi:hypothetical protein